ncbi:Mitochodrial transcription termination factor-related [Macleaya cordata]|uniref:Mitochodrial transcription termination factor-related n=1 Tax=Macleaya cordata TaxID=56857 RepID=A0A200PVM6_MACCD|nr:Mitochodrial transcription termination factor-related [Macleaya cordata]
MLRVLYRDLRHYITTREPTTIHFNLFGVLQNENAFRKSISKIPESTNPPSITVDSLINSCGLPPKTAPSAAKKVRLYSTEKADSVISLFESYGLTKIHIAKLISQRPELLSYDPNKNLKPKFEFLCGLGFSGPDLPQIIAYDSALLTRSLQNQIMPYFNYLKSYIGTTANILSVLKRWPNIFHYNLEKVLIPNILILQVHGVPDCNISRLLITQPRTLTLKSDRFREIVEMVKKFGFDPSSLMFSNAVRTISGMSKSSWERKLMVYRGFGWSDYDILSAFKRHPYCMNISEEKISRGVEFFLEKLKWKPSEISLRPSVLLLSLEKRIIPRCAVLEILYLKGIIRKKLNLGSVLNMSERDFLEKFVNKYQETIPEVMKAYKGGIEFAGFGEIVEVKESSIKAGIDHVTPS